MSGVTVQGRGTRAERTAGDAAGGDATGHAAATADAAAAAHAAPTAHAPTAHAAATACAEASASEPTAARAAAPSLALLGGFELRHGTTPVELPASAQRLVAFLAIRGRPLQRLHVAGTLWLDVPEERANAALRTALWRSRRPGCALLEARGAALALAPGVAVDLGAVVRTARDVISRPPAEVVELPGLERLWAQGELLPDWYDDWVLIERERHRQLRLHALERLCEALTAAGRFGEAAEAGIAAVAGEPLRESAHRALIGVHVAEGNAGEALRQYRLCAELLRDQLGLEPSSALRARVAALRA